jgi:hypothetical protein
LADEQAAPLKSPAGTSNKRPSKQARFEAAPATSAKTPDVTPDSINNAVDLLTKDPSSNGTPALAPQDLFRGPAFGAQPVMPSSQWSTSHLPSLARLRPSPPPTALSPSKAAAISSGWGLTATINPSFVGSLIDGTPISPDPFLFPGLVNLRFRRDFLAQIDPNQVMPRDFYLHSCQKRDAIESNQRGCLFGTATSLATRRLVFGRRRSLTEGQTKKERLFLIHLIFVPSAEFSGACQSSQTLSPV